MRKLNVVIVDDELIVRNGVRDCMDWEIRGFFLAGLFDTAVKAWETIQQNPPDIVITDIRMPVMDGLELAKRCSEAGIPSRFVILSGYDEFRYAQQAIRWGVEGYLLKPVKEEELTDVLSTIRRRYFQDAWEESSSLVVDKSRLSRTVKEILEYVDQNLQMEELSLKYLAEQVLFMNSGYLSKLFVKETGYKFSTFLMISRMERALTLLRGHGEITVYQVASQTGFGNNPQYFSTVFKKYYGFSPSDYGQIENKTFF